MKFECVCGAGSAGSAAEQTAAQDPDGDRLRPRKARLGPLPTHPPQECLLLCFAFLATSSDVSNASETESEKREDYECPQPSDRDPRPEDSRRRSGVGRGRGPALVPRGSSSKYSNSSISSGTGQAARKACGPHDKPELWQGWLSPKEGQQGVSGVGSLKASWA